MVHSELKDIFLTLVRLGIGHTDSIDFTDEVDWAALKTLADQHGLSAIVLDGLNTVQGERLMVQGSMPQMLRLQWIGEVMQSYEQRYVQYEKAIVSLTGWHNAHGYKMMMLKGLVCNLDWPKPDHRPCGDIDIWQFGKQKEIDKSLNEEKGITIDNSHHHHTVFLWNSFSVENHYDFINVHHHKTHINQERVFKELGNDDTHFMDLCGERVYLPSANLHALFLLKHNALHFSTEMLTLRQVLDWAFFVERHGKEVNWEWLDNKVDEFGMRPFYMLLNAICIEDLGFEVTRFPFIQFDSILKARVLNDILCPEFTESVPNNVSARIIFKYRRWKANGWKHELCFKESMWSAFWSGVWGHLMKPGMI